MSRHWLSGLICALATGLLLAALPADAAEPAGSNMLGFSLAHALEQQGIEQRFDAEIKASDLREWLQGLASEPNQVGGAHDRANAEFMLQKFREWGWDANIETFNVLYPTPKRERLELIAPSHFTARLHEPAIKGDASSARTASALPPYAAYGADGDVTAELVYVNYGVAADYQELARLGVDVRGKLVIARYGGGWRPADGVQRGSVEDMPIAAGDPLTPGVGATADAKRLPISEAPTLPKIPVLPISYADAQPLLAALSGPVAPSAWRGALPITYHVGPGAARVHLSVQSDWSLKPIYDVIARIPGAQLPDEWVVRGNHHDGWVFGAWDPLAGACAELAEAKAIGALLRSGWRPRRTLIYASWDGEEPGLLGSTEWAETHAAELKRHAVVYVNSDTTDRGYLSAAGSHSLQRLVNEVALSVHDPETAGSVAARLRAKLRVEGFEGGNEETKRAAQAAASGADLPIRPLGSGSDYSPFLQHLGIASLDLSYSGEGEESGIYHSTYDDFEHYSRFGDPGFVYGVVEAQTVGHLMLRLADADVLPLQFGDLAETVAGYVRELHQLTEDKRQHALALTELLQAGVFELASDPTRPLAPPAAESEVPFLDFAALDNAAAHLTRSARAYDAAYADAAARGLTLSATQSQQLEALLQGLEQALTIDAGLPGRPWYKHLLYAPGVETGYGAKTVPGVREAIEGARWDEATSYVLITARALESYIARLDAATALLRRPA